MWKTVSVLFTDPVLRGRILFVLGALVVFRLLSVIVIPGISPDVVQGILQNNQLLGVLSLLSGGGLSTFSIVMLGVGPYITASIIFQLLTVLVPRLKEMQREEGEEGRKKLNQYSRLAALPLALIQGYALLAILSQSANLPMLAGFELVLALTIIAAGTYLLMWIGEMISERGIGNGVSIIIFAGIVASVPTYIAQYYAKFDPTQIPALIGFLAIAIVTVFVVVYFTEAERPVAVQYARQTRTGTNGVTNTYLPIRVTQAGVMPIIFALSMFSFPQMFGQIFSAPQYIGTFLGTSAEWVNAFFENQWLYGILYFALVFVFTYFYTAFVFEPETISENLQKGGGFIPGIRPGKPTTEHIGNIVSRVTFVGASFFATIAILPIILQGFTGDASLALGGTALLIVVTVVIDVIKKINAQLSMREYI